MPYDLDELKKLANSGKAPKNMDVHERVIFYTLQYCYEAYKKNPTESTKQRLKEFLDPVVEFHYGRKS